MIASVCLFAVCIKARHKYIQPKKLKKQKKNGLGGSTVMSGDGDDDEGVDQEGHGGQVVFVQRKTRKTKKNKKPSVANMSAQGLGHGSFTNQTLVTVPNADNLRNLYPPLPEPRV